VITLDAITKRFGETTAVDALSLEVARGEVLVLLGGSGCGKTTTLKMINRLVEPTSGMVRIDGDDTRELEVPVLRRRIGYCFQQVGLFPHLTVAENIGITPQLLGWETARITERVDALLRMVELDPDEYRVREPRALSGGQAQRVGLARALGAEPEVMLLDEPFGALDPLTRDRLQRSFQEIRRETGITAVFVTHDIVEALMLGDRIAVLDAGRLQQIGPPAELLDAPANEIVAELIDTPRRQAALLARLGHERT
jgi:osmoprotectant transport system ATP-binding protein